MPDAQLTVRDEEYRLPIKALNAGARVAEVLGLRLGDTDPESILTAARRRAARFR